MLRKKEIWNHVIYCINTRDGRKGEDKNGNKEGQRIGNSNEYDR